MTSLIVAASTNRVIGQGLEIPWRYSEDFKWFKRQTMDGVLIMGRKTFESLPNKRLPGREIVVISRAPHVEEARFLSSSLEGALDMAQRVLVGRSVWIAGGRAVYVEALSKGLVDEIVYTVIPEELPVDSETIQLPEDFLEGFHFGDRCRNPADPRLEHVRYTKNG